MFTPEELVGESWMYDEDGNRLTRQEQADRLNRETPAGGGTVPGWGHNASGPPCDRYLSTEEDD